WDFLTQTGRSKQRMDLTRSRKDAKRNKEASRKCDRLSGLDGFQGGDGDLHRSSAVLGGDAGRDSLFQAVQEVGQFQLIGVVSCRAFRECDTCTRTIAAR